MLYQSRKDYFEAITVEYIITKQNVRTDNKKTIK